MQKIQLRGDTQRRWQEFNPVISEREMILIASDPALPNDYDLFKVGDGVRRYSDLPVHGLPAVQMRGRSAIDVMSQKAVTQELEAIDDKLAKIEGEIVEGQGDGHTQNTDTGTDHNSFLINNVLLKCCCNGLVLRSDCDCEYADLTVMDLYIKGKLFLTGQIIETEIEEVKSSSNLIVLNEGETGEEVTRGFSGIEIDRGTGESYMILFDESSDNLKAGFGNSPDDLDSLAFLKDVIRKDQFMVVNELPEVAEEGDFYIIPTEEEEDTLDDFLAGYVKGVERTVNYIDLQSVCKKGDENWVDNTIVITATALYPVKSEVRVLLKYPDGAWQPLITLAPEETTFEFAAHETVQGTRTDLKLESELSDDSYVYAIPRYIDIVKPEPDGTEKS